MASPAIRSAGALRHRLPRLLSSATTRSPSYSTKVKGRRFDKETLASAKRLEEGANSREQHTKGEEEQYAKIDSPGWISLSKKCWTSIHIGGRDLEMTGAVSFLWDIADKIMDSK
ncbi:uncharacterized protein LOC124648368 [Lolium rigidum]|uniref:uncharacterized protein LOC124648368 n=1 Tax=Lolium rigidum TaxID=89674 RepID=UPI001F5C4971|nr:uncharacterized protein LOC124648368 [Lolium rigidum]